MDKEDVVYIYNGVLISHQKGILPFATWMDIEYIMLNEVSKSQKGKYCMSPPRYLRVIKIKETESRTVVARR